MLNKIGEEIDLSGAQPKLNTSASSNLPALVKQNSDEFIPSNRVSFFKMTDSRTKIPPLGTPDSNAMIDNLMSSNMRIFES